MRLCICGIEFNPLVWIVIVGLSIVLGILNNFRVYPERRVSTFGYVSQPVTAEGERK